LVETDDDAEASSAPSSSRTVATRSWPSSHLQAPLFWIRPTAL
jgi:hypothetical protein